MVPLQIAHRSWPYENYIISNTNVERNDVGLFLIEYRIKDEVIKELYKKVQNKAIAIYTTKDSCNLKVNPFETIRTKDSLETISVRDTLLLERECYKDAFPVPNFIDYSIQNGDFWEQDFKIFVLESKSGLSFPKFDLQPNTQMPLKWKNGYSKGVAINKQKRIIIYWSIIW